MKVSRIGSLLLERYEGRTYFLKGNDQSAIVTIEGYLFFLLSECNVPVFRRDILLFKRYATFSEDSANRGRRGCLNIVRLNKRESVPYEGNCLLLSLWKQYPNSYNETLRRLSLDAFEANLSSDLNLQEQILLSIYGKNIFGRDELLDREKYTELRITYNHLLLEDKDKNGTILSILNAFV